MRLKSGHGRYPMHLAKIDNIASPSCSRGYVATDLNHIFLGCSRHKNEANNLILELKKENLPLPIDIIQLLRTNNKK